MMNYMSYHKDYLNLSNVESDAMAISETVRKIEKNHNYRYENRKNCKWNISYLMSLQLQNCIRQERIC